MFTHTCSKCQGKGWFEVGRTSPAHYDGIEYCSCPKGVWYTNASQEDRDMYHLHRSLNWQAGGANLRADQLYTVKAVAFAIASGEVVLPFSQEYIESTLSAEDDLDGYLQIIHDYHNFTDTAQNYAEQTRPLQFPGYAFSDQ